MIEPGCLVNVKPVMFNDESITVVLAYVAFITVPFKTQKTAQQVFFESIVEVLHMEARHVGNF